MLPIQVGLANHLWQSTVFLLAIGALTLLFRRNSAAVRYRLWLIASLKFLIPFSLLVGIGGHLGMPLARPLSRSEVPAVVREISQPFAPSPRAVPAPILLSASPVAAWRAELIAIVVVWVIGAASVLGIWSFRWLKMLRIVRRAESIESASCHIRDSLGFSRIRILVTPAGVEPGVFGIIRPVLLLPEGAERHLRSTQLESIIAHEMFHVRGRHNLTAAVHTIVEAVFWFHPLVWWLGSKLVEERERVCDEAVLQLGCEPGDYAEGILEVCKSYLAAPPCVAGVSGSNLTNRIEAIMSYQGTKRLNMGKRLLIAVVGILVVGCPLYLGMMQVPQTHDGATVAISAKTSAVATHVEFVKAQAITPSPAPVRPPIQVTGALEKWPEEVALIITDDELATFRQLQSETERGKFIEQFWLRRDPTPGTPENEFKAEYDRRVAYANKHYSLASSVPGSKTDRGKMYIFNGPPDEIDSIHPTGGTYRGSAGPGGAEVQVFPFETWRYRHIEGKGNDLIYEFVDKQGNGDYRLEYDPGAPFLPK